MLFKEYLDEVAKRGYDVEIHQSPDMLTIDINNKYHSFTIDYNLLINFAPSDRKIIEDIDMAIYTMDRFMKTEVPWDLKSCLRR